jgi:hypothetical protein
LDELSEDSSSDEDESDSTLTEFNLYDAIPLDNNDPAVTACLTYDKDPRIILTQHKEEKTFQHTKTHHRSNNSSSRLFLGPHHMMLHLQQDSKGLIQFLIMLLLTRGLQAFAVN